MKDAKKLKGKWVELTGSVYESENGHRIHILGVIRKSGQCKSVSIINTPIYWECMNIMGQNNKRALMLVCEKLL